MNMSGFCNARDNLIVSRPFDAFTEIGVCGALELLNKDFIFMFITTSNAINFIDKWYLVDGTVTNDESKISSESLVFMYETKPLAFGGELEQATKILVKNYISRILNKPIMYEAKIKVVKKTNKQVTFDVDIPNKNELLRDERTLAVNVYVSLHSTPASLINFTTSGYSNIKTNSSGRHSIFKNSLNEATSRLFNFGDCLIWDARIPYTFRRFERNNGVPNTLTNFDDEILMMTFVEDEIIEQLIKYESNQLS